MEHKELLEVFSQEIGLSIQALRSFIPDTPAGVMVSEELRRLEELISSFMVEIDTEFYGIQYGAIETDKALKLLTEDLIARGIIDPYKPFIWGEGSVPELIQRSLTFIDYQTDILRPLLLSPEKRAELEEKENKDLERIRAEIREREPDPEAIEQYRSQLQKISDKEREAREDWKDKYSRGEGLDRDPR